MAVDYFLKIDGIEGESQDAQHKGEIELEGFSWGEAQSAAGGGAGKVTMQPFNFVMKTSKASPQLFLACAGGQHLMSARLTARNSGKNGHTFLRWTLVDVVVAAYEISALEGGDDLPRDQASLSFAKIQVEYIPQKPDGSSDTPVEAGWDVKANKKI